MGVGDLGIRIWVRHWDFRVQASSGLGLASEGPWRMLRCLAQDLSFLRFESLGSSLLNSYSLRFLRCSSGSSRESIQWPVSLQTVVMPYQSARPLTLAPLTSTEILVECVFLEPSG